MATEGGSVIEAWGDLFKEAFAFHENARDNRVHIAHCISNCRRMNAGFARTVRLKWGRPPSREGYFVDLGPGCITQDTDSPFIVHHLVTKAFYKDKPTLGALEAALAAMDLEPGTVVHAPMLGCGLDRLAWKDVKALLEATPYIWRIWRLPPRV